ncbi:MAG: hypothetical protein V4674_04140 [Patescibacteria group bacterium]
MLEFHLFGRVLGFEQVTGMVRGMITRATLDPDPAARVALAKEMHEVLSEINLRDLRVILESAGGSVEQFREIRDKQLGLAMGSFLSEIRESSAYKGFEEAGTLARTCKVVDMRVELIDLMPKLEEAYPASRRG